MATYTNKAKQSTAVVNKLGAQDGWQYNEPEVTYNQTNVSFNTFGTLTAWANKIQNSVQESLLAIGDGYDLLIGDGYKLFVTDGVNWTKTAPQTSTYTNKAIAGAGVVQADLLIGDGYKLNIGSGFNLMAQEAVESTPWTNKAQNN